MSDLNGGNTYDEIMDGGISNGGAAFTSNVFNYEEEASGIQVSGSSEKSSTVTVELTSSGLQIGGDPLTNAIYIIDVISVGCQLAGDSPNEHGYIATGGSTTGSTSLPDVTYNPSLDGGIVNTGISDIAVYYLPSESVSGLISNGSSDVRVIILMMGGASVAGDNFLTLAFIPKGGIESGGIADSTASINEPPFGSVIHGLNLFGSSSNSQQRLIPPYLGSGTITILGSSNAGLKSISYKASGGISLQGTNPVKVNFVFNHDIGFRWRLNSYVIKDTKFVWNLGQLTMYWYRVVGKGTQDPCLPQDPCCQKFILNVHARSLTELCQKLKQRRYKFPIDFVQRFSRPAENTVVAAEEIAGTNHDCNKLIDVEVCNVPECADFCVDQDVLEYIGFNTFVQVNAFKEYQVPINPTGDILISGFAKASYIKNLPEYKFAATGNVTVSGNAVSYADHLNMRGGVSMSGSAKSAFSRWSFVGGQWPNKTEQIYPTQTNSIASNSSEQLWSLTERITSDNGLYSSTDISYNKKSQALIGRDFGLNLPSWARIIQIVVSIDRKASSTNVRDREVYLLLGDELISENLAVTDTSWPLIETKKYYVIDVGLHDWKNPLFESQVPPPKIWKLENVSIEDINSANFGVQLKIQNLSNVVAIGRVDYINVQVTYEDPTGSILRTSGQARTKGPTYYWEPTSGISLTGQSISKAIKNYKQNVVASGAFIGGGVSFTENTIVQGGSLLGGEALVLPYLEEPQGGCVIGTTEALVNPAWYTMRGGLKLKGSATNTLIQNHTSNGLVLLSGTSIIISDQFYYSTTGSLGLSGASRVRCSNRTFQSSGNSLSLSGQANTVAGDVALEDESFGFEMSVLNLSASFLTDVELNNLTGLTDNLTKCGCYNLPLTIQLYHNLATNNSFSKFLVRNGLTISRTLDLKYNEINDSWQNNLHYKGLSFDNNSYETWDVISELNCTNTIGSINLGTSVWRLAIQFFKKDLSTNIFYDSRILIAVIPDAICRSVVSQLEFLIEYNTKSKLAVATPNATIYQCSVYDNIGLFKNPAWIESPTLRLKVSQSSTIRTQPRLDLTDSVLA